MNERELKELERLAKAAIEHNRQESEDILEQAITERKDELWQTIQKKARRRVRMRKVRPWIAAAAVVMMAVLISGAVGFNQARAGKDGLLVDIVEGVAGRITFSNEPVEFHPITLEGGTWDDIMDNVDPVMIPLLPEGLPERYVFMSGLIEQPSRSEISMSLKYENSETNNTIRIHYIYGIDYEIGVEEYGYQKWGDTDVHMMVSGNNINITWVQNDVFITIYGLISEEEGMLLFDAIKREP